MCGIVGVFGNIGYKQERIFKALVIMDGVRGIDSTGVLQVLSSGKYYMEKEIGLVNSLFTAESKIFTESGNILGNSNLLLGHNRAATKGSITKENAHPFEFSKIIGVKNGSLLTTYSLHNPDNHPVDSYALLNHINEKGIKDAWENKNGPASLVWWEKDSNKIFFIRNEDRPMYYIRSLDGKNLYFSSNQDFILLAARMYGENLETSEGNKIKIFSTKPNRMVSFNIKTTKKLETKEFEEYSYPDYSGWVGGSYYAGQTKQNHDWYKRPNWKDAQKVRKLIRKDKLADLKEKNKTFLKKQNEGWSEGTERCDKDTRGLQVKLTAYRFQSSINPPYKALSYYEGLVTIGKVQKRIDVFPTSKEDMTRMTEIFNKNRICYTMARVRFDKNKIIYKIDSKNLKVLDEVTDEEREELWGDIITKKTYSVYQKLDATKEEWLEAVKNVNGVCSNCGGSLIAENSSKYEWFGRDICLCEDCKEKEEIVNYLYPVGVGT